MADYVYDPSDLETVATGVLFGGRGLRLEVINTLREVNAATPSEFVPVEYLVNAVLPNAEVLGDALDAITAGVYGAAGSDVTLDSVDLETVFTAALVDGRGFRLQLINIFRSASNLDPVEYLVNTQQPSAAAFETALTNISEAEEDN
jgi:hypothetical protein